MNSRIIVIGILVILLFSSLAVEFMSGNVKGNAIKISDGGVKGYTAHGVIRINNDTDFANQASQEGWPGDGTQSNPYVISGYEIDALGAGDAIYIGNTTVYFVVENCHLYDASHHSDPYFDGDGIMLYNVTNGKISGNNITKNEEEGIYLSSSSDNNTISGNTITDNKDTGIYLSSSSNNNTIRGNNITNNFEGISLDSSSDNTISGSTITNNSGNGIYLDSSISNTISGNNITNNNWCGIYLDISNSNNTISGNNITNNDDYDIYMSHSDSNTINGNYITNSGEGIYLYYSSSNTIYNNLISNNGNYGIHIDSGFKNLIYNNALYYNNGTGDTYNPSYIQAYDDGSHNYWNSSSGIGNYWHDWANNNNTNDQNHDGIVDWPYKIDGSAGAEDHHPLRCPIGKSAPSAPYNLTANSGDGYVNLTWDKPICNGSSPITQYNIYRNGVLIKIKTVSSNQLYYNDTTVQNGQTYTYYVTAVNSVGESDKSNEVQVTPEGAVPEFSTGIWLFIVVLIALLGVIRFSKFS